MKKPASKKKAALTLKGDALAAYDELQTRLAQWPNPRQLAGPLRLLEVGLAELAPRMPAAVVRLLDEAGPVSVADATARAQASGQTWQDMKATLELQLRLLRARAFIDRDDAEAAALEFTQALASPSSRRNAVILEAAQRSDSAWSPHFSLALLRAASRVLPPSLEASLALIDAMTGAGQQPAGALVLGQLIAGWALFPSLTKAQLVERIERLDEGHRPPLFDALAAHHPA